FSRSQFEADLGVHPGKGKAFREIFRFQQFISAAEKVRGAFNEKLRNTQVFYLVPVLSLDPVLSKHLAKFTSQSSLIRSIVYFLIILLSLSSGRFKHSSNFTGSFAGIAAFAGGYL